MIRAGSTEDTYRRWLRLQGPLVSSYQEYKAQEILRCARALDQIPELGVTRQGVVERRARLLRQLRWASKDLREAIAETRIMTAVGGS